MSLRMYGQLLIAGAIGAILQGILVLALPGPFGLDGPTSIPTSIVSILSGVLLIVGLPALYLVQAKQIGRVGLVGLVLFGISLAIAFILDGIVPFMDVAFPGSIPHDQPHGPPTFVIVLNILGLLALLVSGLIVGIVTNRARILPTWIGWLIPIGVFVAILSFIISDSPQSEIIQAVGIILLMIPLARVGAWAATTSEPVPAAQI